MKFKPTEEAEGIWTMTDSEFNRALAEAWEDGRDAEFNRSVLGRQLIPNPYNTEKK